MKINFARLIKCIAIPLVVGGVSAFVTGDAMKAFEYVEKPSLTPPGWIFPVAWSVLYILMGIASYIVLSSEKAQKLKNSALTYYGVQLFFNFIWSIVFFKFSAYLFAFLWLIVMFTLIIATYRKFYAISEKAAYLLILYVLWVIFAGYLNFGVYLLN